MQPQLSIQLLLACWLSSGPVVFHVPAVLRIWACLQVACTALGLNHPILKGRVFDMAVVDEAGQITLPVALGPVLRSR